MCDVVSYPPVPFWHGLPGGLSPGQIVEIRGTVPFGADSFQVNFTDGRDSPGYWADRVLHLSIRMGPRVVVRNTMCNGNWQTEERSGGFPFQSGRQFAMLIATERSSYKIAVNGQHQWEFCHRYGLQRARMLHVDGSLRIEEVRIFGRQPTPPVPTAPQCIPVNRNPPSLSTVSQGTPTTIHNAVIPFVGVLPVPAQSGTTVEMEGFVPHGAESFQINFLRGETIPIGSVDRVLHISVRFKGPIVVYNTMSNGKWENEERYSHFPFTKACHFRVKVLIDKQCYRISVDGQHHSEFRHRYPVSFVKHLYIDGNVIIDRIIYTPPIPANTSSAKPAPKAVGVHVHQPIINPVIPYHYPFPDGLRSGLMIYISGQPNVYAQRFTINLVCSNFSQPAACDNIAFHFDARIFNQTVVRNTRLNGRWGEEETVSPYFPFAPGYKFDMIIRVEPDKYMVAVNGQHFVFYVHRIKRLKKINKLQIENDVTVSSIRFFMT